jgi:hypothetical protein
MHVFLLLALALQQTMGDTKAVFPVVEGRNLEGRALALPADFTAEMNIVVIAFRREQQADVDTWMPALRALASHDTTLAVYELPTIERRFRLMRSFIDGGMRRGIPDAAVRAATITLYIDKGPFKRSLGIANEGAIQVLLVDRAGVVHWRAVGRYTSDAVAELTELVGRA